MQVKTIKGHFITEFEQQLSLVQHEGFTPDLALVFCSVTQNINQLRKIFIDRNIELVGATTAGEIMDSELEEKSIVAMLMKFDRPSFQTVSFDMGETGKDIRETGNDLARNALGFYETPVTIVLSGGLKVDGEELVRGMLDYNLPGDKIFGALAGDDLQMENTYVFTNDMLTNKGVVSIIMDGANFQVAGTATTGWESIGTEKTVTRAEGNVVYSIDHIPALDIFMEYFDKPKERLVETDMIVNELSQYPLQVKRNMNYHVLRAPMLADTDRGALIFSGTVEEGARIKFSVPPGFETIETTTQEISELKQKLPDADALLMFSCKARHQALGPLVEEEVENIRNLWNIPLIGFFSYGEIGSTAGHTCDFHNETVSLVVLKES
mgnify:CR=1 FL=1